MKTKLVICVQKMICDYACFLVWVNENYLTSSRASQLGYYRPDLHHDVVKILGRVPDTSDVFGTLISEPDGSYTVQKFLVA